MSTALYTRNSGGADVLGVDQLARSLTVIVAPYDQPATVEYRGEIWTEAFAPGAFDSLAGIDPQRIRVCREHNRADAVGKVLRFDTRSPLGLIAEIRIAKTQRGDDTLGLAAEGMLSASAGFAVDPTSGQTLDRTRRIRRITHALLDHIGLVMQPAYDGAQVLAVRSAVDAYLSDPLVAWAQQRTDPVWTWARRRTGRR